MLSIVLTGAALIREREHRATKRRRSSITELSFRGIHASGSAKSREV